MPKTEGVRCPNPECGRRIGAYLDGVFVWKCPRCKIEVALDTRKKPIVV